MHGREQGGRLSPPGQGSFAVGSAGALWAALCLALFAGGHTPSGPTGPVPPERWYLLQAAVLPLLLLGLWRLQAAVTLRLLPPGPDPTPALGWAYAGAVALALVVPELVALSVGGIASLRSVAPLAGGAMVLSAWVGAAVALRRVRGLGWGAALSRSLPGLLAQAIVGAPFLR